MHLVEFFSFGTADSGLVFVRLKYIIRSVDDAGQYKRTSTEENNKESFQGKSRPSHNVIKPTRTLYFHFTNQKNVGI